MKKIAFVCLIVLTSCYSKSIISDPIIYHLPLKVENEVYDLKSKDVVINGFILGEYKNNYQLDVITGTTKQELIEDEYYINFFKSNRFIQIDSTLYPLLLHIDKEFIPVLKSDEMLSLTERNKLYSNQGRLERNILYHGLCISFTLNGEVIEKNWK